MPKKQAPDKPKHSGSLKAVFGGKKLAGRRFVFTAAQNNTYLHEPFFKALLRYCAHNKAQLVVSKITYNKNGFQNLSSDGENEDVWYDPRLEPYFINESAQITAGLVWCGELDILPTAVNPLSGYDNYTRGASCIIPHMKVQMVSVPTMKDDPPKLMYTTGAVTLRNYIQRNAGQKASFHHMYAATLAEVDADGDWFVRQLVAGDDGSFQDLITVYSADGIKKNQRVEGINWGDIHAECGDASVEHASWSGGPMSMLDLLCPKYQFVHDLTDFRPRNHHNMNDPHFLAETHWRGEANVEAALRHAYLWLGHTARKNTRTVVIESNHDQALMKWLKDRRGAEDSENAYYWHRLNSVVHTSLRDGKGVPAIFEHALREFDGPYGRALSNTMFLKEDASFEICRTPTQPGIECGMHGHRGPNGSRGSFRNLRNIGKRANVGHSHTAGILDGIYVAGVSARMDLGYNVGPSSWSHSHIVTYPSGKRTIITLRGKKWRAL